MRPEDKTKEPHVSPSDLARKEKELTAGIDAAVKGEKPAVDDAAKPTMDKSTAVSEAQESDTRSATLNAPASLARWL